MTDFTEQLRCRLDGLLQLFDILEYKNGKPNDSSLQIDHQHKISPSNMPSIENKLESTC